MNADFYDGSDEQSKEINSLKKIVLMSDQMEKFLLF